MDPTVHSPQHEALAANQLLDTPELFEMVLLHLPMKDLLFAQAVSKTWKTFINSSNKLQRALFFLPAAQGTAYFHEDPRAPEMAKVLACGAETSTFSDRNTSCYFLYPLGAHGHDLPRRNSLHVSTLNPDLKSQLKKYQVFLNPLVLARISGLEESFQWSFDSADTLPQIDIDTEGYCTKGGKRPEASWRLMLITQPPLGELSFAVLENVWLVWGNHTIPLQDHGRISSLTKVFEWLWGQKDCLRKGVLQLERWETGMDLERLGPFEGMEEVVARMATRTTDD